MHILIFGSNINLILLLRNWWIIWPNVADGNHFGFSVLSLLSSMAWAGLLWNILFFPCSVGNSLSPMRAASSSILFLCLYVSSLYFLLFQVGHGLMLRHSVCLMPFTWGVLSGPLSLLALFCVLFQLKWRWKLCRYLCAFFLPRIEQFWDWIHLEKSLLICTEIIDCATVLPMMNNQNVPGAAVAWGSAV